LSPKPLPSPKGTYLAHQRGHILLFSPATR
jgi:hypothetical protein